MSPSRAEPRAVRDVLTRVARTIEERELVRGGEHTILAVSGGPDSMTLLHAMARLAPRFDLRLHVAHFDHRLREDSAEDARYVDAAARALKLPCTVGVADSTERPRGQSPEEAARNRRSRFLHDLARDIGATRIATGHTLDDQAETVLINLLAGAGRRGLGGIPPRRWFVVRPLIDLRRAQTEDFCAQLRLQPRHDPTNESETFLRNLIRIRVLPELISTLDARLPESLARTADVIRAEDYFLDDEAAARARAEQTEDGGRLPLDVFQTLPLALQRRAIRVAARTMDVALSAPQVEAVRAIAAAGETGKSVDLPGPLCARVEYGFLLIGRAPSPAPPAASVTLTIPGETERGGTLVRTWFTQDRPATWPDGRTTAVIDADRVPSPLRVRRWRAGDRFRPLGMSRGEKKVGDFFTDEKVPKEHRRGVDIVAGDDGSIVWVIGHRIDDRMKVTERTTRALWLSIEA